VYDCERWAGRQRDRDDTARRKLEMGRGSGQTGELAG
jgi:hypothetical protein